MICPNCDKPIGPRDGVATDGKTTVHLKCNGRLSAAPNPDNDEYEAVGDVVVLERPSPSEVLPPKDVLEEVAARAERMLLGEYMPGESQADWAKRKASDLSMVLGANYRIERRR